MHSKLNILLVTEDSALKHSVKQALSGRKYKLVRAGTYHDAVNSLDRFFIVLLVLDYNMPDIKCRAVLNHVRTYYPDIPVVTLSPRPLKGIDSSRLRIVNYDAVAPDPAALVQLIGSELERMNRGGTLSHVSPHLFAQLLEMEERSCVLRVFESGTGNGALMVFRSGKLIDARFRRFRATEAACRVLAWEDTDILIQNDKITLEDRIRADLQSIIVKSAHMKDENRESPNLSGPERGRVPQRLNAFLRKQMNGRDHVDDIFHDPGLEDVISDIRVLGNRFNLGRFRMAAVDKGRDRREIIIPGDPPVKVLLTPQSPENSVLRAIAQFTELK